VRDQWRARTLPPYVTKAASEVKRRTVRRLPAVDGGGLYRPSYKPQQLKRSPYPRRATERQQAEGEIDGKARGSDCSGKGEGNLSVVEYEGYRSSTEGSSSEEEEEMASKRSEEGEVSKLLRYLVDRDAEARKAEAKEKKEREKREVELRKEAEDFRRADLLEMFRQLKEEEVERRRLEEESRVRAMAEEHEIQRDRDAERRREEEEARRRRKKGRGKGEICNRKS